MRPRAIALGGVVLLLALLSAVSIGILLNARSELRLGASEFTAAQTAATRTPAHTSLSRLLNEILRHVERAHAHLQSAHDRLLLLAPLIEHLGWLPRYGQEFSVGPAAASLALDTDNGLLQLLSGLGPLAAAFDRQRATQQRRPGPLLAALAAGRPDFDRACTAFGCMCPTAPNWSINPAGRSPGAAGRLTAKACSVAI